MYCKYCGNLIADDSVFCNKCGKYVRESASVVNNEAKIRTDGIRWISTNELSWQKPYFAKIVQVFFVTLILIFIIHGFISIYDARDSWNIYTYWNIYDVYETKYWGMPLDEIKRNFRIGYFFFIMVPLFLLLYIVIRFLPVSRFPNEKDILPRNVADSLEEYEWLGFRKNYYVRFKRCEKYGILDVANYIVYAPAIYDEIKWRADQEIYDVRIGDVVKSFYVLPIKSVGDRAILQKCQRKDYGELLIPSYVTESVRRTFSGCLGLTSVVLPDSLTSISEAMFSNCSDLKSITISNNVTNIGDYSFSCCGSLTSIIIPNSVTTIGYCAFGGCSGLTSITIPKSVTQIRDYAFKNCSNLKTVTISDSISNIGEAVFSNCVKLNSVYCFASSVPKTKNYTFHNVKQNTATLYVPSSAIDAYKMASQWKNFGRILPIEE